MSTNIKNSDGSLTKISSKTLSYPINTNIGSQEVLQDAPIGSIISFMGTTAPAHYLICDGTTYNISDYQKLADHFMLEFGSYNYFGGDGVTTFAVPDLRGEFLRGTGDNSHTNQGSGSDVGKHQDGTAINYFFIDSSNRFCNYQNQANQTNYVNADFMNTASSSTGFRTTVTSYTSASTNKNFTTRPTNTSVLYCIKYEPTYFMSITDPGYSNEEIYTGKTWIDGRPIYRKYATIITNSVDFIVDLKTLISSDIDNIINKYGYMMVDNGAISTNFPCNFSSEAFKDSYINNLNKEMHIISGTQYADATIYAIFEYIKTTD